MADSSTITEEQQPRPPLRTEAAGILLDPELNVDQVLLPGDRLLRDKLNCDYRLFEAIAQDDQVFSCFQQRRLAVTSKEWEVLPPGTEDIPATSQEGQVTEFIREQLERLDWDAVTNQMLWGQFYGFAIAELMWDSDGRYITLPAIKVRKQRRFRFSMDAAPLLITHEAPDGVAIAPSKFWWLAAHEAHGDDPYGGASLASRLYWPVTIKQQGVKFWLNFLETFVTPGVRGIYPTGTTKEEQQKLLGVCQAIANGSRAVIHPEGLGLELIEASRSGSVDYQALRQAMDAAIAKVILSQTMTTDNGASLSQAQVHEGVRDAVVKADSDLVNESFNRNVIAPWTRWNFGPDVRPPKVWRRLEGEIDLKAQAETDRILFDMGFVRSHASVQQIYGDGIELKPEPSSPPPMPPIPPQEDDDDPSDS